MIAVVAFGNPLRGDDGVAWRVAQELEHSADGAVVLTLHQLTPEVAVVVSQAAGVIFVDAAEGPMPGRVSTCELAPVAAQSTLTHHITPETVLALAQRLYGTCPRAALVTVTAESFAIGEALSTSVKRAVPEAVRAVQQLVRTWSLAALPEGTALSPARIPHA
jgi:hydrogenase maturation protease